MIGGTDIVFTSPANIPVADFVLHACRDRWPNCLFQDAESEEVHPLSDPWVWQHGTKSTEFFVYRDRAAADKWQALGAHPDDANSMLHFLVRPQPQGGGVEVTLVCDREDAETNGLVETLKSFFLSALSEVDSKIAA